MSRPSSALKNTLVLMAALVLVAWPLTSWMSHALLERRILLNHETTMRQHASSLLQEWQRHTQNTVNQKKPYTLSDISAYRSWQIRRAKDDQWLDGTVNIPGSSGDPIDGPLQSAEGEEKSRSPVRTVVYNHKEWLGVTTSGQQDLWRVEVFEESDKIQQQAWEMTQAMILPQLVVVPAALLLLLISMIRGFVPLSHLRKQISERRYDDFSALPVNAISIEFQPFVLAFNQLLERLERYVDSQRRFISNAAHQLKTPVTGLRVHAEMGIISGDYEEALKATIERAEALTQLMNALMHLAALDDSQAIREQFQTVDLGGVCKSATAQLVPLARKNAIQLQLLLPTEPAKCNGNATLVDQMICNLLDNAIKYSRSGESVELKLERSYSGQHWCVRVADSGPGFDTATRNRLFQRFARGDRTAAACQGHGLGLAIVRQIADIHQAVISLENRTGPNGTNGSIVVIRLPLGESS